MNVTFGIKNVKEMLEDAKGVMKSLERGKKVGKKKPGITQADSPGRKRGEKKVTPPEGHYKLTKVVLINRISQE